MTEDASAPWSASANDNKVGATTMNAKKDQRSAEYAALKEPTGEQYEVEKQRILREHGREAMLAFAKEEHLHDYLAETGQLDAHEVLSAKDLSAMAAKRDKSFAELAREWTAGAPPRAHDRDPEPER